MSEGSKADQAQEGSELAPRPAEPAGEVGRDVRAWLGSRFDRVVARVVDLSDRNRDPSHAGAVAVRRTGGIVARWSSFPRGARMATAATSVVAAGLAGWALAALVAYDLVGAAMALAGAVALMGIAGPMSARLANRVHRLIGRRRLLRVAELRALSDRKAVAVRGVVMARQTAASALEGRPAVWSITRFRRRTWLGAALFHEVAFDFLLDDGTDEPILVEVKGGMLLDAFPADRRVQFSGTTLLEIDHPFLSRLRLGGREIRAAEINIAAGDVVEVVGRLCHRLDPTARAVSSRDPPQRRALRGGMRVPVMVRRSAAADAGLARVRRLLPKGPPDTSSGEPPMPRF